MLRLLNFIAAGVAATVVLCTPAAADVVTIGAIKDASIFANNVDNSNGAGPGMFAGTNGMDSRAVG